MVNALRELVPPDDVEIFALRDKFATDTPDLEWIPECGRREWIIVSKDQNQRRRQAELAALRKHGCRAIYIRQSPKNEKLYDDAARIIRNWPKIAAWGHKARRGEMAKLNTSDQVVALN
ncbi:MAG: hypothetical protein JNJ45_07565 [Chthonomonas sp.]|nr:hypothetical protein [Chthonomonas sp.]